MSLTLKIPIGKKENICDIEINDILIKFGEDSDNSDSNSGSDEES